MAKFHFCVPLLSSVMVKQRWSAADNPDGRSVESLFTGCIRALLNQTASSDISIHVGYHELPAAVLNDSRIIWHKAEFSRPPGIKLEEYNRLSGKILPALPGGDRRKINDKYSKLKLCLSAALADPASQFVMFVDSDDLIHRSVAEYALENAERVEGGHTVTSGYGWRVGDNFMRTMGGFHQSCGSCNVIRLSEWEKDEFAKTGDVNAFDRKTYWLFAGHASVHKRIRKSGRMTEKLPFRAAVYVTGTGYNFSGAVRVGSGKVPLTESLKADFSLL